MIALLKYKKQPNSNQGFTLVEVLVAMVVLTIIVIAFTAFFGWNVTSIFDTGEKSRAIAKAESKLEKLYGSMENYKNDPDYVDNCENVSIRTGSRDCNFCVTKEAYNFQGSSVDGYNVQVVVFYSNGERHVSLSSFIEGGT